jgi:hypothetical protein
MVGNIETGKVFNCRTESLMEESNAYFQSRDPPSLELYEQTLAMA